MVNQISSENMYSHIMRTLMRNQHVPREKNLPYKVICTKVLPLLKVIKQRPLSRDTNN